MIVEVVSQMIVKWNGTIKRVRRSSMKGVIPKEVLIHFVGDVPYVAQVWIIFGLNVLSNLLEIIMENICVVNTWYNFFLDSTCDAVCGCGFSYTPEGLDGTGKTFTNPGEGIDNCATDCRARDGCTSFEYNHEGDEGFLCGTYTGGSDNLRPSGQKSTWTSCVQGI